MKNCLECGEKIVGREDKNSVVTVVVTPIITKSTKTVIITCNINNKLRKNHRILSELNTEGKSKQPELNSLARVLILIFTNILNTKTGNTYYFLYDQGYMLLDTIYVKKKIFNTTPQFPKYEKKSSSLLPLFLF
jgi:hypothetical protein